MTLLEKNTDRDLVSVIICNYNYADFISEAIESVLKQTYLHFELIIVDDGSTDKSSAVINTFSDPRIVRIYQENKGQAAAFNSGFKVAQGEIICFLDSDDYWYPEKLQYVVEVHKTYGFVQHNLYKGEIGKSYKKIKYYKDHLKLMTSYGIVDFFVPTSGLSFKRSVLANFFPIPEKELKICADAYLTRMSLFFSKLKCIDNNLGFYRTSHQSYFLGKSKESRISITKAVFDVLIIKINEMGYAEIPFLCEFDQARIREGLTLYNRASTLKKQEQLDESEALFLKVEQFRVLSLKFGALFHLGVIQWKRKNYDSARDYFKKSLIYEPDHKKAIEYLSMIKEKFHE